MQVMVLPIKNREQGITARGTECAAALLGTPLRDLSRKVFINVKMQLSMVSLIFILKIKNLKLGVVFFLQYCILKCIFIYCPNYNSTSSTLACWLIYTDGGKSS